MSVNGNNHGLPFLPGYTFRDVTKSSFHRSQTLDYKNGYAVATVGIGQDPLLSEELSQQETSALSIETPGITYGSFDHRQYEDFIPAYVALDKKVLRFYAYFEEHILLSPEEYRVRPMVIYYYLEDDSMCITEPEVRETRLKRHRLPKNERGEHYQWKDLNLGMDLKVYGFKYHITHCDAFTKEFMESEGIILNDPEQMPVDPYSKHHKNLQPSFTTPSEFDRKHQ